MKRPILIALGSALITAAAIEGAPALAQQPTAEAPRTTIVRTGDLDLRTDAGRRALDRRIAAAAREVCGAASDADVRGKNEVRKCRDETLASARTQRDGAVATRSGGKPIAVSASR